jgi:hypothetical protein
MTGFPHACSLIHSPPRSRYSSLVTLVDLASSVTLHSAIPFHASNFGSPPSNEETILSGARKGRTGVRALRSRGKKFGILEAPPVTKIHLLHQLGIRTRTSAPNSPASSSAVAPLQNHSKAIQRLHLFPPNQSQTLQAGTRSREHVSARHSDEADSFVEDHQGRIAHSRHPGQRH